MLELTSVRLLTTLGFGFLLGIKHASDSDHIIAVSTIVSEQKNLLKSTSIGAFWGIGHTVTLLLIGTVILTLKLTIPEEIALFMEILVGIMLLVLGISVIWDFILKHLHTHNHLEKTHIHFHSHKNDHNHEHFKPEHKAIIVGMVHGLAGSAALMLLVLTTLDTILQGLFYIFVFGIGSILSMISISFIISMPFVITPKKFEDFNQKIKLIAGITSITLGASIIYTIVFI